MIHFVYLCAIFCLLFIYVSWIESMIERHKDKIQSKGFFYELMVHGVKIVIGLVLLEYLNTIEHVHGLTDAIYNLWSV